MWTTDNNNGVGTGPYNIVFGGGALTLTGRVAGTLYTNGTYTAVSLTGGTGSGAKATIVVSGGGVSSVTLTAAGTGYTVGDVLSATSASIGGTG